MRNLLIDDIRNPGEGIIPTDCVVARTYDEGLELLFWERFGCLYLDHDLGCFVDGKEYTGYDILCAIERKPTWYFLPLDIKLVTANPVGRARMEKLIPKLYEKLI